MSQKVNIGCGNSPTEGWRNFDNTSSLNLARSPTKRAVAKSLGLLSARQKANIEWNRENLIEFADATKEIPLPDNSVGVLYSSHMLEHIARSKARRFLAEAMRVLEPGGILRLSVPDLRKAIAEYNETHDADRFMERILVTAPAFSTIRQKIMVFVTGYRHHQWMYDGKSLSRLLKELGFKDVTVQPAGETMIDDPGALDLKEREEQSVYVEARK